jgi:hypothetical protein
LISFEFFDYPEEPWYYDICGINVNITWVAGGIKPGRKTVEVMCPRNSTPQNSLGVIVRYLPSPMFNWEENFSYFDKLREFSFYEKMKVIFKTFSIRTTDGEYVIRDIDDLWSANIIHRNDNYVLEIHDL